MATEVATMANQTSEFINRDLGWLEFNRRVLHEALDPRTPLLERVKFLGIFTSNLDEFFMKRVGRLKGQIRHGVYNRSPDGLTPEEQMQAIRTKVAGLVREQGRCFTEEIRPQLMSSGIQLLDWEQLSAEDHAFCRSHFTENIFPVLIPLAVDPGHPFPFISNLSMSLAIILYLPNSDEKIFARVKIPKVLPRWIPLPPPTPTPGQTATSQVYRYISLQEMVHHNLDALFPGMVIVDVMPFKITRNADVERDDDEDDDDDLIEIISQELKQRRFERAVRIEHGPNPNPWLLQYLKQHLELTDADVYELPGELDYTDLFSISGLNVPELRDRNWSPITPMALGDEETDLFTIIRSGDLLLHHPYESFTVSTERFIRTAAEDPNVLAIKMTVYRVGDDTPFVRALIKAAEAGKQVVCLVEVTARFDEERNILWAHALEKSGVHVVYGVVGLKTHTKTTLVVRREGNTIRSYAHIGTGNYHVKTARLYTDLGLLTCDPEITADVVELFHFLTGKSLKSDYNKLLIAPVNIRPRFLELIEREIAHHQAGRPAAIVAKMNQLEDIEMIEALYKASQAGVPVDIICRGFCCLRPGVEGLSENIRVISVIGRFLEHSRIYHFRNGATDPSDGEYFIGSADWMSRNLSQRVEAITPIERRPLKERLWNILDIMLRDHRQAWDMHSDGSFTQRTPPSSGDGPEVLGTHETLMHMARSRIGTASPTPEGELAGGGSLGSDSPHDEEHTEHRASAARRTRSKKR